MAECGSRISTHVDAGTMGLTTIAAVLWKLIPIFFYYVMWFSPGIVLVPAGSHIECVQRLMTFSPISLFLCSCRGWAL